VIKIEKGKLCDYGCEKEAKFQFKNGKWCCSSNSSKCEFIIKKIQENNKGKESSIKGKTWDEFYGKEKAKKMRKNMSEKTPWSKGKKFSKETRLKMSLAKKGKPILKKRKKVSKETRLKMSLSRIGKKDSPETRKRKSLARQGIKNPMYGKISPRRKKLKVEHPFFCEIEKPRERNRLIEVRCKFCKKWFAPTYDNLRSRIFALEHINGTDGLFLYCSDDCKSKCPVYHLHGDPNNRKKNYPYTPSEEKVFRAFVLERENYICEYCGEPAIIVHHIRPQKLEPFFALDPDYAIAVCEKCHYEKGHPKGTECSTGNLANKVCWRNDKWMTV